MGSRRKMTHTQKDVVIGMILGDAYLQKTGKQNARLRLEHSINQRAYLDWKVTILHNYFQSKVQTLTRVNTIWNKTYQYVRIQSMSSSDLGELQRAFYKASGKVVPENIALYLRSPLSLAVWFMDDGYYYPRDRMAYIYIPNLDEESRERLLLALKTNFSLEPVLKQKKKGLVLIFNVSETQKLMKLIKKYILPSMRYKIPLDPVSTDRKLDLNQASSEMVL